MIATLLKYFPYKNLRKEQQLIMSVIYEALNSRRDVLIEAASGIGKTVAVLTATMPFIEQGHKVIYLTRTHAEIDKVIDEIARINQRGTSVKGIVIRGRSSLCINPMVATLPAYFVDDFCNILKSFNACKYFINSQRHAVDLFNMRGDELKKVCLREKLCPYESLLNIMPEGDVIVMTYNYLMINELRDKVFNLAIHSSSKPPIIILDEAHNLQELIHSVNSAYLNLSEVMQALKELEVIQHSKFICSFMNFIMDLARACKSLKQKGGTIPLSPPFDVEDIIILRNFVNEALHLSISKGNASIKGLLSLSTILRLLEKFFEGHYILLLRKDNEDTVLELFNPNPLVLKKFIKRRFSIIAMSATLSPLNFYSKTLNMRRPLIRRIPSPYVSNALFIVYTRLNTSFKNRGEELYSSALSLIMDLDSYVPKGKSLAVFVPSYEFLRELVNRGLVYKVSRRVMTEPNLPVPTSPTITDTLYASVLGGKLSEGVDLRVSVCLIIGVPYAKPDYKLMMTLKEYSKIFPGRARKYAYVLPAVRRAIQASGRLLRHPEDRGVIIFADKRYVKLIRYFPKWMIPQIRIIKRREELLKYVSLFSY